MWEAPDYDKDAFTGMVEENLRSVLMIRVRAELLAPGSIERTEGKAKRVIDLRKG